MSKNKIIYILLLILFVLNGILFSIISYFEKQSLQIAFLDVGQGDAILISKGQSQILIDAGPDGQKILEKLGKFVPFWDRKIEVVMNTHPDADHIGGMPDILGKYKIGTVIESGVESDTQVFKRTEELVSENNVRKEIGKEGVRVKLGEETDLEILSPFSNFSGGKIKDTNLNSLVSKLTFGKNSFLFMADAPKEREDELISRGINLKSQVLKVGHHGSKYSSGKTFLEKVSPREAIISVGKNNRYGHPTSETLQALKDKGINILRTDEAGDIIYECNFVKSDCQLEI